MDVLLRGPELAFALLILFEAEEEGDGETPNARPTTCDQASGATGVTEYLATASEPHRFPGRELRRLGRLLDPTRGNHHMSKACLSPLKYMPGADSP